MLNTLILLAVIITLFVLITFVNNRGIVHISAAAAHKMIGETGVEILDVRTPHEYATGHIRGARLIPLSELSTRLSGLALLKDHTILIYCHSGSRSTAACRILKKSGFLKVYNLQGGVTAWIGNGGKIVKGK